MRDLRLLESVQRRWTKRITGLSELDYKSRLQVDGRLECVWLLARVSRPTTGNDPRDGTRLTSQRKLNKYLTEICDWLILLYHIQCWKIFHGKCADEPADLFTLAPGSATRGHRCKVLHDRAETHVRTRSFAMWCVQSWNALPDRVVAETNLGKFKGMLANCLGDALYAYQP